MFPALRALQHTHPVHADLILVQGGLNYCGGLTTVFPPGAHADTSYTWAASYPRHVGGVGILAGVDAENYLQAHVCDVFHGGITIPTTNAPSHWMSNGHSFVAVFQGMQGRVEIEELLPNSPTTYQAVPVQAPPATTVSSSDLDRHLYLLSWYIGSFDLPWAQLGTNEPCDFFHAFSRSNGFGKPLPQQCPLESGVEGCVALILFKRGKHTSSCTVGFPISQKGTSP